VEIENPSACAAVNWKVCKSAIVLYGWPTTSSIVICRFMVVELCLPICCLVTAVSFSHHVTILFYSLHEGLPNHVFSSGFILKI
jgi:hypothetical protein